MSQFELSEGGDVEGQASEGVPLTYDSPPIADPHDALDSEGSPDFEICGIDQVGEERQEKEEIEPEPGFEEADLGGAVSHVLSSRIQALEQKVAEAAAQQDFRKAWRLNEEKDKVKRIQILTEQFERDIEALQLEMRAAAAQEEYSVAERLKEDIALLRSFREERVQLEEELVALEVRLLEHAASEALEEAVALREEIAMKRVAIEQRTQLEEQRVMLRKAIRDAVHREDFAAASQLKAELQQLDSHPTDAPPPDPAVSYPTSCPAPVTPHAPSLPPSLAAPAQPPSKPLSTFPSHTPPSKTPPHPTPAAPPPSTYPRPEPQIFNTPVHPQQQQQQQHQGADDTQDVVAHLASLIWESSQENPSPRRDVVDPYYRRRLLNFYQHYNPSKLPSVTACLMEYKGYETQLFDALVRKYGPEPTFDVMAQELPPGWRLVESTTGDVFYLHSNGRKQWERPLS